MKKNIFLTVIALFILIAVTGCEKDIVDSDCYSGELIARKNRLLSLILIRSSPKGSLPVGESIGVREETLPPNAVNGDIIEFKITKYKKWDQMTTADWLWPTYQAAIELCK